MPNYRVSWGSGCALEVLPDGSVNVEIDDDFALTNDVLRKYDNHYGGLIIREDAKELATALVRALASPRRFCPDCRSSAITPSRETPYDEGPGSECKGCGWTGPTAELREA